MGLAVVFLPPLVRRPADVEVGLFRERTAPASPGGQTSCRRRRRRSPARDGRIVLERWSCVSRLFSSRSVLLTLAYL